MSPAEPEGGGDASAMVEAAIDGLYRLDLDGFVGKRNALAKQLKEAGDAANAKRVRACKKPSLSTWVVNRLWWDEPDAFADLVDAAQRVGRAQQQGAGPSERADADKARRRALGRLMEAAAAVLSDGGRASSAATLRRISTTLEAIAARDPQALDPPPGRLVEDLDPPGFDLLSALASMGTASPARAAPKPAPVAEPEPDEAARAKEALEAAERHALDAARTADEADRARDEAQAEFERLQAELRSAREALEAAQRRAEKLQQAERNAQRIADERTRAAHEAAARAHEARTAEAHARQAWEAARKR